MKIVRYIYLTLHLKHIYIHIYFCKIEVQYAHKSFKKNRLKNVLYEFYSDSIQETKVKHQSLFSFMLPAFLLRFYVGIISILLTSHSRRLLSASIKTDRICYLVSTFILFAYVYQWSQHSAAQRSIVFRLFCYVAGPGFPRKAALTINRFSMVLILLQKFEVFDQ